MPEAAIGFVKSLEREGTSGLRIAMDNGDVFELTDGSVVESACPGLLDRPAQNPNDCAIAIALDDSNVVVRAFALTQADANGHRSVSGTTAKVVHNVFQLDDVLNIPIPVPATSVAVSCLPATSVDELRLVGEVAEEPKAVLDANLKLTAIVCVADA